MTGVFGKRVNSETHKENTLEDAGEDQGAESEVKE
jgi:hypothetical protein